MIGDLVIGGSLVLVVVILFSILGTIDRRERYAFVAGIALFIIAHAFVTTPEALGVALAVIGIGLAGASAIPMLRQSV